MRIREFLARETRWPPWSLSSKPQISRARHRRLPCETWPDSRGCRRLNRSTRCVFRLSLRRSSRAFLFFVLVLVLIFLFLFLFLFLFFCSCSCSCSYFCSCSRSCSYFCSCSCFVHLHLHTLVLVLVLLNSIPLPLPNPFLVVTSFGSRLRMSQWLGWGDRGRQHTIDSR